MNDEKLKQFVKTSLRISTDAFDENEIDHLIEAAKEDITASCDQQFDITNMNECKMVALYVKANFGDGDSNAWELYQSRLKTIAIRKGKADEQV